MFGERIALISGELNSQTIFSLKADPGLCRLWQNFSSPQYGNCFSFNYGGAGDRRDLITFSNTEINLRLELFLNQKQYMGNKLSKVCLC